MDSTGKRRESLKTILRDGVKLYKLVRRHIPTSENKRLRTIRPIAYPSGYPVEDVYRFAARETRRFESRVFDAPWHRINGPADLIKNRMWKAANFLAERLEDFEDDPDHPPISGAIVFNFAAALMELARAIGVKLKQQGDPTNAVRSATGETGDRSVTPEKSVWRRGSKEELAPLLEALQGFHRLIKWAKDPNGTKLYCVLHITQRFPEQRVLAAETLLSLIRELREVEYGRRVHPEQLPLYWPQAVNVACESLRVLAGELCEQWGVEHLKQRDHFSDVLYPDVWIRWSFSDGSPEPAVPALAVDAFEIDDSQYDLIERSIEMIQWTLPRLMTFEQSVMDSNLDESLYGSLGLGRLTDSTSRRGSDQGKVSDAAQVAIEPSRLATANIDASEKTHHEVPPDPISAAEQQVQMARSEPDATPTPEAAERPKKKGRRLKDEAIEERAMDIVTERAKRGDSLPTLEEIAKQLGCSVRQLASDRSPRLGKLMASYRKHDSAKSNRSKDQSRKSRFNGLMN